MGLLPGPLISRTATFWGTGLPPGSPGDGPRIRSGEETEGSRKKRTPLYACFPHSFIHLKTQLSPRVQGTSVPRVTGNAPFTPSAAQSHIAPGPGHGAAARTPHPIAAPPPGQVTHCSRPPFSWGRCELPPHRACVWRPAQPLPTAGAHGVRRGLGGRSPSFQRAGGAWRHGGVQREAARTRSNGGFCSDATGTSPWPLSVVLSCSATRNPGQRKRQHWGLPCRWVVGPSACGVTWSCLLHKQEPLPPHSMGKAAGGGPHPARPLGTERVGGIGVPSVELQGALALKGVGLGLAVPSFSQPLSPSPLHPRRCSHNFWLGLRLGVHGLFFLAAFSFSLFWYQGSNAGPCACEASGSTIELNPQPPGSFSGAFSASSPGPCGHGQQQ